MIKSYRDLDVWQKTIELIKLIYTETKDFPKEEVYGLVSQMRRSAVSIASNIAEGKTRQHVNEYIQFLYIALGSCAELETQIVVSQELLYFKNKEVSVFLERLDHIARMIRNLIKRLKEARTDNRSPKTNGAVR